MRFKLFIVICFLLSVVSGCTIAGITNTATSGAMSGPAWTTLAPTGDPVTDTANIRAAVAKGDTFLSPGDYKWDGSGTEFVLITKPISFVGNHARLVAPATMTKTQDWIRIYPVGNDHGGYFGSHDQAMNEGKITPMYGGEGLKISGLALVVADDSPRGRHGIHFDFTDRNAGWVSQCEISSNVIRAQGGQGSWGIYINNPYLMNALFASNIEKNKIWGGIYAYRMGDSNNIQKNQVTGHNYSIFVDRLVPGASMTSIFNNNLTGYAGVVKLVSAPRTKIYHNNAELYPAAGYSPVAMYEIDSADGSLSGKSVGVYTSTNCEIVGNLGGVWAGTATNPMNADAIKITNASGTYIDNNELYTSPFSGTYYDIRLTSGAVNTKIGKNNTKLTGTGALLFDEGVGTVLQ